MEKELLKGLSEEQIAKVKACKNADEIIALAREEGVELNEEQLETVNGGCSRDTIKCPKCGSTNVYKSMQYYGDTYTCNECDFFWRGFDHFD